MTPRAPSADPNQVPLYDETGEGAEGAGMLWGSLAGFVVPVLSRGNTAKLSEVDPLATNALS